MLGTRHSASGQLRLGHNDGCLKSHCREEPEGSKHSHKIEIAGMTCYVHVKCHTVCGGLNVICLHKLIRSGMIRRCGFVGMGVALLEEMCPCRGGL